MIATLVSGRYNRATWKKDLYGDCNRLAGVCLVVGGIAKAVLSVKDNIPHHLEKAGKPLLYSSLMLYFGYNLYILGRNIKKTDALVFKDRDQLKQHLLPDNFLFKPFTYTFVETQAKVRKLKKWIKSQL